MAAGGHPGVARLPTAPGYVEIVVANIEAGIPQRAAVERQQGTVLASIPLSGVALSLGTKDIPPAKARISSTLEDWSLQPFISGSFAVTQTGRQLAFYYTR